MDAALVNAILCLLGLAGLYFGGEKLVTGSVTTANNLKIKPQLIAITIVALGTSFPELVVSVNAVVKKSQGIAWGNVVGSNISNLLCVLGIAAIVTPLSISSKSLKVELFWLVFASGVLVFSVKMFANISGWGGAILIALLIAAIFHMTLSSLQVQKKSNQNHVGETGSKSTAWMGLLTIFLGVIILIGSAELVVYSAKKIAEIFVVPEALIGLTIVSLGTSLPEVAASIVAVQRGHADIAIGNVIGSNIFNSLGIIGVAALASGTNQFIAPGSFIGFDIPVMFAVTIVLGAVFLLTKRISRHMGIVCVLSYLVYISATFQQF